MTLWAIWHARRKALHEEGFQRPAATHAFIHRYLSDLAISVSSSAPRQVFVTMNLLNPWCVGFHYGAVAKATNRGSISVVCRNSEGVYLGYSAISFSGMIDPTVLKRWLAERPSL